MATPTPEPPSSSPWIPFIFGGIFLIAAILIFAGVMSHPSDPPADDTGSANVAGSDAPSAR